MALFGLIAADVAAARGDPATADLAGRLEKATAELQTASMWLMTHGMADPDHAGTAAYSYMTCMSVVTLGWMWLRMAVASGAAIIAGEGDRTFYEAKQVTARFCAKRMLPDDGALRRKIESGAESMMALPLEAF